MIVALSGVDGAGKSTQLRLLGERLSAGGHRIVELWYRPGYSEGLNRVRGWLRRRRPASLPTAAEPEARQRIFGRPWVQAAWIGLATADTLLHYGVKVRVLSLTGRTVLCDRYLEDALLDLRFRFPARDTLLRSMEVLLRALVPRPHVGVLLNLSHGEMLLRAQAKDEPFPDPAPVRDRRFRAYQELARAGRFDVVDASPPIDVIREELLRRVLRAQRSRRCG
jgi:dTMP kinase